MTSLEVASFSANRHQADSLTPQAPNAQPGDVAVHEICCLRTETNTRLENSDHDTTQYNGTGASGSRATHTPAGPGC